MMAMLVMSIWVLSYERFFETEELSKAIPIYPILLTAMALDIAFRTYILESKEYTQHCSVIGMISIHKLELVVTLFALYRSV